MQAPVGGQWECRQKPSIQKVVIKRVLKPPKMVGQVLGNWGWLIINTSYITIAFTSKESYAKDRGTLESIGCARVPSTGCKMNDAADTLPTWSSELLNVNGGRSWFYIKNPIGIHTVLLSVHELEGLSIFFEIATWKRINQLNQNLQICNY